MEAAPAPHDHLHSPGESRLSARFALILAAWLGLVGGYLDLAMIVVRKDILHASLYYEQGRNFLWVVPVASLAVLMIPSALVAAVNRLRPGSISLRAACWLFAALAIWGPLLRAPLYGVATFLFAAGLGRWISGRMSARPARLRRVVAYTLLVFAVVVGGTAVISLKRQALAESRALAQLPAAPPRAENVLLLVLDTVRAEDLGLYGYERDTTPHLARWAKRGVRFDWALAPAPWTFPSHCSFLTGQWPSRLSAHWKPTLDPAFPTLAEYLSARGYRTAGFAANTHFCSYESGMDRGFAHYEDYPLTPRSVLGSTMLGRWLLTKLAKPGDHYSRKWIHTQSRDACGINRALLDWLDRRPQDGRPFFAFLNYLDAHEPFLPPAEDVGRFGVAPQSRSDYALLADYWDCNKLALSPRQVALARDSYDNCIAALDRQIGALLDELERRGVLRDTHVIITSDHGEQFGEHGTFNHGYSAYLNEVHVPLLILSPSSPAGRRVAEPVSLRDLPATVVDLLHLKPGSPFPGSSLADRWRPDSDSGAGATTPALSEVDIPVVVPPERGRGAAQRGFTVSLVTSGQHYLLNTSGVEELYAVESDPRELHDRNATSSDIETLNRLRRALLRILVLESPGEGIAVGYMNRLRSVLESRVPAAPLPKLAEAGSASSAALGTVAAGPIGR